MKRIGFSEDIHQVSPDRKLYLGGLFFPNEPGLVGHSDADVVLHAIAESILGALALGDLGAHFPDNDDKYLGISSLVLLDEVVKMMEEKQFKVSNLDVQVCLKAPKLRKHIDQMREIIAAHLKTSIENVSVKACSYNGVGEIGEGKAIKAIAYIMLEK